MKSTASISRKVPAEKKSSRGGRPKAIPGAGAAHPNGEEDHDETIRLAAYAFYEARGRVDGHALEDWEAAKALVAQSATNPVGTGNT